MNANLKKITSIGAACGIAVFTWTLASAQEGEVQNDAKAPVAPESVGAAPAQGVGPADCPLGPQRLRQGVGQGRGPAGDRGPRMGAEGRPGRRGGDAEVGRPRQGRRGAGGPGQFANAPGARRGGAGLNACPQCGCSFGPGAGGRQGFGSQAPGMGRRGGAGQGPAAFGAGAPGGRGRQQSMGPMGPGFGGGFGQGFGPGRGFGRMPEAPASGMRTED